MYWNLLILYGYNFLVLLIYGVSAVRWLRWPLESLLGANSTKRYLVSWHFKDLFYEVFFHHCTDLFAQVAALFYVGTTKSHPPIPEHLSTEAKDFLLKCLQKYVIFFFIDSCSKYHGIYFLAFFLFKPVMYELCNFREPELRPAASELLKVILVWLKFSFVI